MITFKAIIIPGNRRKDGTYPVNIRVTFKGVSRRLSTTLVCKSQDLTRGNRIKNADILSRSDELINRMRGAVKDISPFDLDAHDVDWVVTHIKDTLSKETFHLDFFEWADMFLLSKNPNTRKMYISALNALERHLGVRSIDINAITRSLMLDFMDMVDKENKCYFNAKTQLVEESERKRIPGGVSTRHIARLEHIFNAAKDKFNDEDSGRILIPRSPFSKITRVYPASNGQSNLGVELMQRIISARTDDGSIRTALDIFIVSFALMGANMADLWDAKPVTDEWVYHRAKTRSRRSDNAEMRVVIPEQIRPYLDRLRGKGAWWLNVLHEYSTNKDNATHRVNRCLQSWCKANGVDSFTFYAARHTWASLARKAGVDKSTIDECLAHAGNHRLVDIYAERSWELLTEANNLVLEMFTW